MEVYPCILRCNGTPPCFLRSFTKGNNLLDLLFAFLVNLSLLNWSLLLKERICSFMSKFFSFRVVPPWRREANTKMASLESAPSRLKDRLMRNASLKMSVSIGLEKRNLLFSGALRGGLE